MAQSQEDKLKTELEKANAKEADKAQKAAEKESQAGTIVKDEKEEERVNPEGSEASARAALGVHGVDALRVEKRESEAGKPPKGPSVSFRIVGRNLAYGSDGEKVETEKEEVIYFPTNGNEDIDHINRLRRDKGYALLGYHNFPPKTHPKYDEFALLAKELDSIINPPEARHRR